MEEQKDPHEDRGPGHYIFAFVMDGEGQNLEEARQNALTNMACTNPQDLSWEVIEYEGYEKEEDAGQHQPGECPEKPEPGYGRYEFPVVLGGWGYDPDGAWTDACEGFCIDWGATPDEYEFEPCDEEEE